MRRLSKIHSLAMRSWATLLVMSLFITSCMQQNGGRTKKSLSNKGQSVINTGGGNSGGNSATPTSGEVGTSGEIDPTVEIRWVIDPQDGTYTPKVSLAKNYSGVLYIMALNATTLTSKQIGVRFKFGVAMEPIILPATVTRGIGITPQTDIELIALDFSDKPFENLALLYDLYDYNKYTGLDSGVSSFEPVSDPRDSGLYCRGLSLQYDPTVGSNLECDNTGITSPSDAKCLYGYVKLKDKGLMDLTTAQSFDPSNTTGFPISPSEPQVAISSLDYNNDTAENKIKKCLPDDGKFYTDGNDIKAATSASTPGGSFSLPAYYSSPTTVGLGFSTTITSPVLVNGSDIYYYQGPYRAINYSQWEISGNDVINRWGVYRDNLALGTSASNSLDRSNATAYEYIQYGMKSNLFPLYGKMDLPSAVEHLSIPTSAVNAEEQKVIMSLGNSGETDYMDGCNIRTANFDPTLNEGIGSCNITATIEIVEIDPSNSNEVKDVIAESSSVKIQILRASDYNEDGEDVRFSSFKRCSSSNTCGSGECCFNERCWSDSLVSSCVEDAGTSIGGLLAGNSCSSDYECQSFCCNRATGKCAVHDNTLENPVLCQHPPGNQCISKEWCRQETVTQCYVVKTGIDSFGQTTCALRCYNKQEHGECRDGTCVPPIPPAVPVFDPANPDCTGAIDPPTSL